MSTTENVLPSSVRRGPRAFDTIVLGGLVVGILDFIDASTFFPLYYGISVQSVWHGVAAGLLGPESARAGGWNTALLGIFLHFVIAFGVATVYYFASRSIPFLLKHPAIGYRRTRALLAVAVR